MDLVERVLWTWLRGRVDLVERVCVDLVERVYGPVERVC